MLPKVIPDYYDEIRKWLRLFAADNRWRVIDPLPERSSFPAKINGDCQWK
jgi:hypothetical protein